MQVLGAFRFPEELLTLREPLGRCRPNDSEKLVVAQLDPVRVRHSHKGAISIAAIMAALGHWAAALHCQPKCCFQMNHLLQWVRSN